MLGTIRCKANLNGGRSGVRSRSVVSLSLLSMALFASANAYGGNIDLSTLLENASFESGNQSPQLGATRGVSD